MAALLTPCREIGEVDPLGMRELSGHLASHGCDGLFVLSSTGEMILVDEPDRRRLVQAAREGAGSNTMLFAGIGGGGVRQAVRFARLAQQDGADVAVAMAPFFQILSQQELASSLEQIADESPIPIAIYHHLRMQTPFSVETVARLAAHPNIIACKDTSVDLSRLQQLVAATHDQNFLIYQGSEKLILESLILGAHGCVSALAGIAPEWHAGLIAAFRTGDLVRAEQFQEQLLQLIRIFQLTPVKASLAHFVHVLKHAALQREWIPSSASLLPGFEPPPEFNDAIEGILQETGLHSISCAAAQKR